MKRSLPGLFLASLGFSLFFIACTKVDTTDLGTDLIPVVDNINTFETILEIESDNHLFNDSTKMYLQDHALGVIDNDPEFGKTTASIFFTTEPTFGSYPFQNRDSVVIDSLVLSLAYTGLYGDSTSIQQFEVREIDNDMMFFKKDTAYRIDHEPFLTYPEVIGSKMVNFTSLNDSIRYVQSKDTVGSKNELRIHLDPAFGRRFVNYDTATAYKNDSIFKSVFKGFEVKVNEGMSPYKNALAYFDLTDNSKTKLTFYCRVVKNGVKDTINPVFVFSSNETFGTSDPHANIIKRTPGNGYLSNINNGSTDDELLYIQSSPGSYATVKIPGLDTLNNRVVHLAELVVEKIPSVQENYFTPPGIMFLDAINNAGDTVFTIKHDFIPGQEYPGYDVSGFGGVFRNNRYNFNITRYVQGIVTKNDPSNTLRLYAPYLTYPFYMMPNGVLSGSRLPLFINPLVSQGRIIVGGGSHPTRPMRLRIIYSKI